MATNTHIAFDEATSSASTKLASYQITEDGAVKKLSRAVLSDSTGAELGTVGNPINITGAGSGTSDSTEATQLLVKTAVEAANTLYGAVNETAPATDTASSGHNGRLQRIAQKLTALITLFPTSIGQTTKAGSLSVALASDQGNLSVVLPAASEAHSTAQAASLVIKASAGELVGLIGYNNSSSDQYIQVHNAASLPADAAVPIFVFKAKANDNFSLDIGTIPYPFSTGIVVCNSSTLATKTIGSANCWFNALYK
ncbi:MAG: hypothetical protein ACXWXZ_04020 [Candidatus Binatia bacterium]